MLSLSRKFGEEIVMRVAPSPGVTEIVVSPVRINEHNGETIVGINAPATVTIHRREVQDQIDKGIPQKT